MMPLVIYTGVATKVPYVAIGGIIFQLNKHLLIAVQMIQDLQINYWVKFILSYRSWKLLAQHYLMTFG